MRRREFIATLGGAAALSFSARAQSAAQPVIGYLRSAPRESNPETAAAFRPGPEGRIVSVEAMALIGAADWIQFRARCPLWVKSQHQMLAGSCPLYSQQRTSRGK